MKRLPEKECSWLQKSWSASWMITRSNRLTPNSGEEVPITKGQVIEEPCDEKLSSTVLKGRWGAVMPPSTPDAMKRFIKGDSNGKRSGKPRFKGKNRYRTFAYQRVKPDCIQGNRIELPKLGKIKFIQHRPIPNGFVIK